MDTLLEDLHVFQHVSGTYCAEYVSYIKIYVVEKNETCCEYL